MRRTRRRTATVLDDDATPADPTDDTDDFIVRRAERGCRSRRSSRSPRPRATPGQLGRGQGARARRPLHTRARRRRPSHEIALVGTGQHVDPNDFLGTPQVRRPWSTCSPGYDWQNWNVELFATNIFDERNRPVALRRSAASARSAQIVPGRPRTIGLRAGYEVLARSVERLAALGVWMTSNLLPARPVLLAAILALLWLAMLLLGAGAVDRDDPAARSTRGDEPWLALAAIGVTHAWQLVDGGRRHARRGAGCCSIGGKPWAALRPA